MNNYQEKPLSKLTNKEWRGVVIAFTFLGVFIFFMGLYQGDFGIMKLGIILTAIGIIGGLILHFFFGVKIIQLRRDIKHPKY